MIFMYLSVLSLSLCKTSWSKVKQKTKNLHCVIYKVFQGHSFFCSFNQLNNLFTNQFWALWCVQSVSEKSPSLRTLRWASTQLTIRSWIYSILVLWTKSKGFQKNMKWILLGKRWEKGEQGNQQNRGVMWAGYSAICSINMCLTI